MLTGFTPTGNIFGSTWEVRTAGWLASSTRVGLDGALCWLSRQEKASASRRQAFVTNQGGQTLPPLVADRCSSITQWRGYPDQCYKVSLPV